MKAVVDGVSFTGAVDSAVTEIIHWRWTRCRTVHWHGNVFKVSSGKTGKAFVAEMRHLLRAYAEGSTELMFQGKIKPAMRLLTRHGRGGKLNLDDLVPISSMHSGEQRTVCMTSDT